MSKLLPALLAASLLVTACAHARGTRPETPAPPPPLGAWAAADARALSAPPALVHDPAALAAWLTRGAGDDTEKARAIFRWLAENIAHDFAHMNSQVPVRPESVLVEGKSICDGYAGAFELLGRLAGLEVVTIHGWAKGYDWTSGTRFDKPNHAWNAVRIGGEWKPVDPTWGAGYVRDGRFVKQLDDYFFLPAPEALAFTHLAEDARWALVPHPSSRAVFEAQPVVRAAFFRAGFTAADARLALASRIAPALVEVFLAPGQPIVFRSAPAEGVLAVGRSYRFEAHAPAGASLAVVNGGRWQYLRAQQGLLVASVTPRAGAVYVTARAAPDARYETLLRYEAR